jgi:hypothetical protein
MAWQVTVQSALGEVVLPDGLRYQGGAVVVLSDEEYGQLSAHAVASLFSAVSRLGVSPDLWLPADDGLIAANIDPALINDNGLWTSGAVLFGRVSIRQAATFSKIGMVMQASGSGSSTGTYMGIYTLSGGTLTLARQTADCAADFEETGITMVDLASPLALPVGPVWCGALVNMAVSPGPGHSAPNASEISGGAVPARGGVYSSGLTSLPASISAASVNDANGNIWAFYLA